MRPLLQPNHVSSSALQAIESFHVDHVKEAEAAIQENKYVIIGMAQNPVVSKARKLLTEKNIPFKYIEHGSYFSKWKERLALKLWSGWPTFPMIFVDKKLIGGCKELMEFMKSTNLLMLFATVLISFHVFAAENSVKPSVHFDQIKENQTFKSPFKIKMLVEGLKVRPAGEDVTDKQSGHHHLLINTGAIPEGQVIPADETHLHYGKGQTEAEVKLAPGDYTLTLQFANGAHLSYGPSLSKSIKIKVVK